MNRSLFAVVLGVGMMGLMGCATSVDDPVPPTPAPEAQREPPKQALNIQLRDPQQALLDSIAIENGISTVPAKEVPPGPLPSPE